MLLLYKSGGPSAKGDGKRQDTIAVVKPRVSRGMPGDVQGFVGSAKASIDSVDAACQQVGSSQHLQGVLRAVLAVGNALNTGTARAQANGVKLDSLMKLADVKVLAVPAQHRVVRSLATLGADVDRCFSIMFEEQIANTRPKRQNQHQQSVRTCSVHPASP